MPRHAPRRRVYRHERLQMLLHGLIELIARRAVLILCWLVRCNWLAYPRLIQLCHRRLLPLLSPFTADISLRDAPRVQLRCFQLGGVHHADVLSEWLLYSGSWQPPLSAWLCRTLRPGDTFVDVGANTGYFSLLAASLVGGEGGGKVIAVEACPRTFRRLQLNLSLNRTLARGCVRSVNAAAAEAVGEATLYQHRRDALYNTTVAGAGAGGTVAQPDVWSLVNQSGAVADDPAAGMAVSRLASESACWRCIRVPKVCRLSDQ